MKAMLVREFGAPAVMKYEDVPTPSPGPGEVLMEVHAVSVNRTLDLAVRAGTYARKPDLPHVLGVDPVGVVAAVGEGVSAVKKGERITSGSALGSQRAAGGVLGVTRWGGYAEYVKLPQESCFRIPEGLGYPEACVVARHFPTAFYQLRERAGLKPGEWLLVMGAAGGLGACCVQVGKLLGAKVIAAAGADERVKLAMELGADHGVNYRKQDLTAEVKKITGGAGVNVVSENIADPTLWPGAFYSLAPNGRLVTAGAHGGGKVELDVNFLYLNGIRIQGGTGQMREDFDAALAAAAAGKLKAPVDRIMPLKEAVQAHELLAKGGTLGKIILDPTLH
jgi:NADPH:quinone reductase-like Zn-dependent oxidoreductase